ncbi:hypothetical protein FQN55_001394 [Onygenales sp. PD_40]|nr:hypothetical protein FQN55_001394 [Onygenales sp. PD_40]
MNPQHHGQQPAERNDICGHILALEFLECATDAVNSDRYSNDDGLRAQETCNAVRLVEALLATGAISRKLNVRVVSSLKTPSLNVALIFHIEKPCRNCRSTNRECIYPVQDRNVTVSESYIRSLETRLRESGGKPIGSALPSPQTGEGARVDTPSHSASKGKVSPPLVENSRAEVFVAKLKRLQETTSSSSVLDVTSKDSPQHTIEVESHETPPPSVFEGPSALFSVASGELTSFSM